MSRHVWLSAIQFGTLVASLLSQMLLAHKIGPGVSLDAYFAAMGFASAVLGGVIVASTYLVPAYITRQQAKANGNDAAPARAAGEALVALGLVSLPLVVAGLVAMVALGSVQADAVLWSREWFLIGSSWASSLFTVATSTLSAVGAAHRVVTPPMVLSMLPPASIATYLLLAPAPSINATAAVFLCGVASQAVLLAWILRDRLTIRGVAWPSVKSLALSTPLAALGAICFSGYAAVDAMLAPGLGAGVLSHQALGQRLVVAFGSVLCAGPFMLAPTELGTLVAAHRWTEVQNYVARSSLAMIGACVASSLLMPSAGALIVEQLFQRGTFTAADTFAVSSVVRILLLGSGPMLATAIVFRALHALGHQRAVAAISAAWLAGYAAAAVNLADALGNTSLAVAYTLSWAIIFLLAHLSLRGLLRRAGTCGISTISRSSHP